MTRQASLGYVRLVYFSINYSILAMPPLVHTDDDGEFREKSLGCRCPDAMASN